LLVNARDLALDRILFKFIENSFEKLTKLISLHHEYFNSIGDEFDLHQFTLVEDIEYLIQDYPSFNVLVSIDTVIGLLWSSTQGKVLTEKGQTWSFEEKIK